MHVWDSFMLQAARFMAFAQGEAAAPAAGAPGAEGAPSSPMGGMWLFFVAMLAIMYFFLFRPQQKREKERKELLASLSKGDRVMTNGGMLGTIVGLSEKTVVLRVSDEPNVKIEFLRGAVSRKLSDEDTADSSGKRD